jgi:hypothetical protein
MSAPAPTLHPLQCCVRAMLHDGGTVTDDVLQSVITLAPRLPCGSADVSPHRAAVLARVAALRPCPADAAVLLCMAAWFDDAVIVARALETLRRSATRGDTSTATSPHAIELLAALLKRHDASAAVAAAGLELLALLVDAAPVASVRQRVLVSGGVDVALSTLTRCVDAVALGAAAHALLAFRASKDGLGMRARGVREQCTLPAVDALEVQLRGDATTCRDAVAHTVALLVDVMELCSTSSEAGVGAMVRAAVLVLAALKREVAAKADDRVLAPACTAVWHWSR